MTAKSILIEHRGFTDSDPKRGPLLDVGGRQAQGPFVRRWENFNAWIGFDLARPLLARCSCPRGHPDFRQVVGRKNALSVSGQSVCGGWKASTATSVAGRSPQAWQAGGATLRGRRDLLNCSPRIFARPFRTVTSGVSGTSVLSKFCYRRSFRRDKAVIWPGQRTDDLAAFGIEEDIDPGEETVIDNLFARRFHLRRFSACFRYSVSLRSRSRSRTMQSR